MRAAHHEENQHNEHFLRDSMQTGKPIRRRLQIVEHCVREASTVGGRIGRVVRSILAQSPRRSSEENIIMNVEADARMAHRHSLVIS